LGSEVCRCLRADGHRAIVFDLFPPGDDNGAEWVRGDIRDGLAIVRAAHEHGVSSIVHLAALLTFDAGSDARRAIEINSLGMANALEAARILGIGRFVWASTAGVFAKSAGAPSIANDAPYRPADVYGGTKVLNETLADHYHGRYGLETVGFRFPLMMGAAQPTSLAGLLGTELIEKPVRGEPSTLPYSDDVPNWLWIGDAARALMIAAVADTVTAGNYNLGGDVRPFTDAIAIIEQLVPGARISTEPGVFGLEFRLETALVEERFGFTPEWQLEDQLRELVERARSRLAAQSS
jgi:nucleoside-diphosphate-sugar epimerase